MKSEKFEFTCLPDQCDLGKQKVEEQSYCWQELRKQRYERNRGAEARDSPNWKGNQDGMSTFVWVCVLCLC